MQEEDYNLVYIKPERKELNKFYNIYFALIISLGGFYFGFYIACFNPLGSPILTKIYEIEDSKERSKVIGNINLLFAVGALIAVFFTGILTKKFGRIGLLIISEFLSILTYFGYNYKSLNILLTTRFFSGLITGFNSSGQVLLKELLTEKLVNFGGMVMYISVASSICLSYCFGMFISQENLVKFSNLLLVTGAPFTIIRIISLIIFRTQGLESPKFYFENYERREAREKSVKVLKKIYKVEVLNDILMEIEDCYEEEQITKPNYTTLCSKQYKMRLISALIINIGQQFSGINFLIFYSTDLFNSISNNGELITFLMGVANIVIGFGGFSIIECFGRRNLFLYGSFLQGIGFLFLNILILLENYTFLFVFVILYQISFDMGLGATSLIYTSEVLPPIGVGVALSVQWVCTGIIGKSVPILVEL